MTIDKLQPVGVRKDEPKTPEERPVEGDTLPSKKETKK